MSVSVDNVNNCTANYLIKKYIYTIDDITSPWKSTGVNYL